MMEEAIKNFPKQFEWEPTIENSKFEIRNSKFLIVGMGGSHLAGDLIKTWNPSFGLIVWADYGLPAEVLARAGPPPLVIANSYSGNTEETLDAFNEALKKNLPLAAISIGGKLLELAKKNNVPYIQMPDTGIQPRSALGFNVRALLKLMGEDEALEATSQLASLLKPEELKDAGQQLAEKLKGFIPIIYSSNRNLAIAYNWKIKFNETGKVPAFYNVFSELNHNEMTGFGDVGKNFQFIFLRDSEDHLRVQKRMAVTQKILEDRGFNVNNFDLNEEHKWYRIFKSLVIADWTAYHTALLYGHEPEQVPVIEEFKKLIV